MEGEGGGGVLAPIFLFFPTSNTGYEDMLPTIETELVLVQNFFN